MQTTTIDIVCDHCKENQLLVLTSSSVTKAQDDAKLGIQLADWFNRYVPYNTVKIMIAKLEL